MLLEAIDVRKTHLLYLTRDFHKHTDLEKTAIVIT